MIPVHKSARFGRLEGRFGVVSVMEVLWDEQNAGQWLMAFQSVGSHDTQQAKPD